MRSFSSLAKLRSRRRSRESGAIIFVVAMTLVVLGSMGAYALRAAATETRTSGYARASSQTRYLTEYGALGVTHILQGPSAQFVYDMMQNPVTQDGVPGRPQCSALASVPSTITQQSSHSCRVFTSDEASLQWTALNSAGRRPALDPWTGVGSPGSFGTHIRGNFLVEVTEPMRMASPSGFDQNLGFCFASFTLTATATTFPDLDPSNSTGILAGQNVMSGRAHVTGGPVICGKGGG